MTLRLEELRLLPPGTADKLKAGKTKIRDYQRELGLLPIPGNDDLLPRRYQVLALQALEQELISEGQFPTSCVSTALPPASASRCYTRPWMNPDSSPT